MREMDPEDATPSSPSGSKRSPKRRRVQGLDVAVIHGAGRVGLPLALVLAENGHYVRVVDEDARALEAIRRGHMPFHEAGGSSLLAQVLARLPERFVLTSEFAVVHDCGAIIVTMGTPVDEHLNPDFAVVEDGVRRLRPFLRDGQTLVLRSALFPGTSARLAAWLREEGLDVSVSFCPERLAEGRRVTELKEVPQIISGSDARALAAARALFGPLGVDLVELELLEAEVAPLFLNAWRYVAFGTANQFYHIATSKGLDFGRIRAAIMYKYRRASGFPAAGFTAGPRLFKDTMQLAAYCRHTFSLGHAAMLVNETMPDCLLEQARRERALLGRTLAGARCGILGMAFKPGSDDCEESLAFKLRRLLLWEGAQVSCSDEYIHRDGFVQVADLLAWSEVIFVGCPHASYQDLVFKKGQHIINCWGDLRNAQPGVHVDSASADEAAPPRPLRVAVVGGAGHVGLPLSLLFAERGHHVIVVDTDAGKLEAIRGGHFPFLEAGGTELLTRCLREFPERLGMSNEYSAIQGCDIVLVTIGTPVDEHLNPCFNVVEACVTALRPHLRPGQTLLLRSTLFPGASQRVLASLRAQGVEGVGVSFCPERIAQGEALNELLELPQIVSGSDPHTLAHAKALFRPLGVDLVELEVQEAETAKLFLNAWRYVIFGTANQFYHIAASKGLDFGRIRNAIMHRYPRAAGFPRSGFTAGPCLFKDTMQLAAYCRHTFSLGHAAMLVNETMPDCTLELARRELAKKGGSLVGMRCGILGMAFKPDNDDARESLAFKLRRLLLWEGAEVLCTDVYLRRDGFVPADELLERCELVFVGCPHREYRALRFREGQQVYDCWGSLMPHPAPVVIPGTRGGLCAEGLRLPGEQSVKGADTSSGVPAA